VGAHEKISKEFRGPYAEGCDGGANALKLQARGYPAGKRALPVALNFRVNVSAAHQIILSDDAFAPLFAYL